MATITISDKTFNNIMSFCQLNGLNFEEYVNSLINNSFMTDKYGERPDICSNTSKKQKSKKTEVKNIVPEENITVKEYGAEKSSIIIETEPHKENIKVRRLK